VLRRRSAGRVEAGRDTGESSSEFVRLSVADRDAASNQNHRLSFGAAKRQSAKERRGLVRTGGCEHV